MSFTHILYIIILIIICAYIFGVVMVSVFQMKMDSLLEKRNNSNIFEKFTSQEEEELKSVREEQSYKSDLNKIFEEESKRESEESKEESKEENKEESKEKNYISLLQKSLDKNEKNWEDGEEIIVIKKRSYIENMINSNKKDKATVDKELIKLFGSKEGALTTNVNGHSPHDDTGFSVWNFDYEKHDAIKNICFQNHQHSKECTYGQTNYADPSTMSIIEKRTFTLNYPPNMTMQDYVNWLYCFIGREDQLPYNHLKNLEKLKKGIPLVKEEGVCPPPPKYFPPLDAEKYFKNMYDTKTNELAYASQLNSTTSSLVGSNYNQYSEFGQNFDVYGNSGMIVNPDIAYKKSARDIDNIIIPKNGNDLDLEKKYKPLFVKQVEQ
jgi:hypothetical protein